MNTKNKILLSITGIIFILLISIGATYAYFTANLEGGEDSTTITVTGGTMNIIYSSGANISLTNIIPNDNMITSKDFIVTGNNSTDMNMGYQISLVVDSNSFSEESLKYKLISTNTNDNGTVAPSVDNLNNIGTGSKTIDLGIGEFTAPTGGNKVHTYKLEIYFPNAAYNQNIDQEKEFKAHIGIKKYVIPCSLGNCLKDRVLGESGGVTSIEAKTSPDFSVINGVSGLFASSDEYGMSYYFRGERDLINNNLLFGGFQWKIIRINGDSSIRVIYNGTEEEFNQSGNMNTNEESTQIAASAWNNINYGDNKYLGYMYGGANGVASQVRNGTTSDSATYNETSTNVKTILDNWYQTNISGKEIEEKISDNLFCNDRRLQSEVGGEATGTGYGVSTTHYAGYYQLNDNRIPSLKCDTQNDRFTKNDTVLGNGNLNYPVGLLTANEAAMAGLVVNLTNSNNYLTTNHWYWTLTPYRMNEYAEMWVVYGSGHLSSFNVDFSEGGGIRPVLNLSSILEVTGNGTITDPYRAD